jgi:hypothetical protein
VQPRWLAPVHGNQVRTRGPLLPALGPPRREKIEKNPLSGVVCLLTKGDLIRVRCRFAAISSFQCIFPCRSMSRSHTASLLLEKHCQDWLCPLRAFSIFGRQHFLNFLPDPQRHGAFLPGIFVPGSGIPGASFSTSLSNSGFGSHSIYTCCYRKCMSVPSS